MERSSAYESMWVVVDVGSGRSCRKRLKRVGERTAPCGTPLGRVRAAEGWPLRMTRPRRPEMKDDNQRRSFLCMSRFRIFSVRRWRGTVSNALLMSMVASVVLLGGEGELKPSEMSCVSFVRYVVVLRPGRNPCW